MLVLPSALPATAPPPAGRVPDLQASLTEEQWLRQVIDLAAVYNWRSYHVDRSAKRVIRRSGVAVWASNVNRQGKGFPDLVLVRRKDRRLIFAELKVDVGARGGTAHKRTTAEQDEWLEDLRAVGAEVYVWRPAEFDAVERILRPSSGSPSAASVPSTQD